MLTEEQVALIQKALQSDAELQKINIQQISEFFTLEAFNSHKPEDVELIRKLIETILSLDNATDF